MVPKVQAFAPHMLPDVAPTGDVLAQSDVEVRLKPARRRHGAVWTKRKLADMDDRAAFVARLVLERAADLAVHCTIPVAAGMPAGFPGCVAGIPAPPPGAPDAAASWACCIIRKFFSTSAISFTSRSDAMP